MTVASRCDRLTLVRQPEPGGADPVQATVWHELVQDLSRCGDILGDDETNEVELRPGRGRGGSVVPCLESGQPSR
ncbi:MAG: hypothetical protein QOH36_1521 [Actinomycetota bacterium]|jgi:hypothetical protein|nr:hypothetical protein [Actinomycetota bacterium]